MLQLNDAEATTKVVRNVDMVIIKKEETGSGKGKGKGRFGENVGGERIVRKARDDIVDKGFGIEEGCLEHACNFV